MRYFVLPSEPATVGEKPYPVAAYLDEFVWNRPEWRQSRDWHVAYKRCLDAVDLALKGDGLVIMTDEDFEKFSPLATVKGIQVAPAAHRAVCLYAGMVLDATDKNPKAPKVEPPKVIAAPGESPKVPAKA